MKITFKGRSITVQRESDDPKYYGVQNAAGERSEYGGQGDEYSKRNRNQDEDRTGATR